jgi:deoxyribonuclease V
MIAFVDVQYAAESACAACVVAQDWGDTAPAGGWTTTVSPVAAYQPGEFFRRELPCLLAVLKDAPPLEAIVVDGYVWLDAQRTPGLGAHLFHALGGRTPVIGLAKTAYRGSAMAIPLPRPGSKRPLYLTCVGLEPATVLGHVRRLQGASRIPTLLGDVDRLARAGARGAAHGGPRPKAAPPR